MTLSKRLSILFFSSLLFSVPVHAQQWYQVEVVVFALLNAATDEQSPVMPPRDSSAVTPQTANSKIQPAKNDLLAGVAERLRSSANYRVLSHQSWQQSGLGKNASQLVAIDGERVSGYIRVYRSAYLHSELDLWLEDGGRSGAGNDQFEGPRSANLKETRRVRSNELHYFDHPRFGAILQLTPVNTPDAVLANMQGSESYALPE